jgi:serine/threonine protein phosphatase 1
MPGRTFAIGDIHGDLGALQLLFTRLPPLVPDDTIVFLGDYVDRGPDSAGVVKWLREFQLTAAAKVVTLRGNHEDAWLQCIETGWPEFIMPRGNGCLECYRSFTGKPIPTEAESPTFDELKAMYDGSFLPSDVVAWMKTLGFFYEDDFAIYVHAGIKRDGDHFPHPSQVKPPRALLWLRDPNVHPAQDVLNVLFLVMGILGVLALALSSFLVTNTIGALDAQQIKQIGVMKAIGADTLLVMRAYARR